MKLNPLKTSLASLVCLGALSSNAKSAITFYNTPTWEKPRIAKKGVYLNESEYNNMQPGQYSFRTTLKEVDGVESTTRLDAYINGPKSVHTWWPEITISPHLTSFRSFLREMTTPGNYTIKFSLPTGESIERPFTIVPESSTLALLGLGAIGLGISKRRSFLDWNKK